MKRGVALIVVLILLSSVVFSQTPAASEPPSREDVLKLMDVMHSRDEFERIISQLTAQMKQSARESYRKQHPEATEERLKKLDTVFDGMAPAMTIDQLLDDVVPVYQKYLSKQDVAATTAFYRSESGQRFLKAQPAIAEEGVAVSDDKIATRVEAYLKRLTERMEQFAKEEK